MPLISSNSDLDTISAPLAVAELPEERVEEADEVPEVLEEDFVEEVLLLVDLLVLELLEVLLLELVEEDVLLLEFEEDELFADVPEEVFVFVVVVDATAFTLCAFTVEKSKNRFPLSKHL